MGKRILVVDDSPVECQSAVDLLTKEGYTVLAVDSGEKAVEQAFSLKPDLIIMDIVMPGMNGFQATKQIAADSRTSHIPIVMCTTKGQATDKAWAERQGAKGYVVKPIGDELLAVVSKLLS